MMHYENDFDDVLLNVSDSYFYLNVVTEHFKATVQSFGCESVCMSVCMGYNFQTK